MDQPQITYQQVGVLIEDLKSQFRVVAENQTGLREELKRDFSEKFEFLNGEISIIKKAVTHTSKSLNKLETKVDHLEDKVDHLQVDVTVIKEELPYIRIILSDHEYRLKKVEAV